MIMTENDDHISSLLRDLGSEPHDLPLESVVGHIPVIRRRRTLRTIRRVGVLTLAAAALLTVSLVSVDLFQDRQYPSVVRTVDITTEVATQTVAKDDTEVPTAAETPKETPRVEQSTHSSSNPRRIEQLRRTHESPQHRAVQPSRDVHMTVRPAAKELRPYADVAFNTDVLGTLVKVVGKHDAIDVVGHGSRDVMCLEAVCAGGDRREISCMGSSPVPEVVTRPNGEVVLRRHRTSSAVVDVVGVTSRIDGTSMLAWYDCGSFRDKLPSGTTCTAYRLEKMGDVTAQRAADGSIVVTFLNGDILPTDARITIQGLDNRPFGPLTRIAGTDAQEIGIVGSLPPGLHKISWTTSDGQQSRLVVIP